VNIRRQKAFYIDKSAKKLYLQKNGGKGKTIRMQENTTAIIIIGIIIRPEHIGGLMMD
jgi:hypothetical protein